MQKITVIDKTTMEKVEIDSNIIKLEKGSIIQTKILREDVAEIIQDGNNLIIKMKNGETVTIENYFAVDAEGNNTELVFEGTECAFLLLDWQNGIANFKELAGLEELLPIAAGGGSTASNLLPWIVGGALVGGAIIAADGSNGSSKDQPKVPEAPIAPVITINPVVPDKDGTTTLTGTVDNPNADVIVTLDGQEYKAKVDPTPNADGTYNWTVDVPTSVLPPAGEDVPVKGTITDPNTGLISPPGVDEAPVIVPPKAPVVTIDPVVPDKDGTTTITGTVDNPSADVIISIGGKDYLVKVDPTPNEDGTYNWTVDVPTAELPPIGQDVPVKGTVTDPNTGLVSEPGQDEAPVALPPKAPYVTIDPIVPDADSTTTLTGTVDEPNADVTVTIGGKEYPVIIDPTPNKDGTYNWTVDVPTAELPPVGQDVPVKGTVTDPNTGLVSEPGTDETTIPNTGVIPAPKVEITTDSNNDGVINGTELGQSPDVSVKITIPKEAKVGDTLTVIINGGEPTDIIITDDMLSNGYITSVPPQANGKVDVTATITDQSGNTSGKGGDTAVLDTTPPTVTVSINEDGTVTFKFNEPVKNFDLSDIVIAGGKLSNLVENKDGTWSADLSGTKQGITVDISVKDKSYTDLAGNEGSSGTDKKVTIKIDSITPDGNTAIISGTTEQGNKVTVTLPDGSTLVSEPADQNGHWTVTTDKPLVDGNTVDAVTDDQDGKPTSDDVLLPFVSIDIVGDDDILNEGELVELTDFDGNITITGTVSNPSASMTITFNGKVYSGDQVTVNADGTWSIKVPASDVLPKNDIKAKGSVVGADDTLIESNVAERPVGQDITPPNVDVEITAKGEIIIQFDADVDPSSINPKDFIIVDKNGNPVKVELIPSKDSLTWTGKVPSGVDGDITVTVPENSYKDYAGNLGGQGTANKDIDTTAPSVEVDIIANANDKTSATATFTFSEDIDPKTFSSADLTVTGGRVVGEPKQNADGTWTVELKVEPGQTVKVEVKDDSYTDLDGNKGSGNDDSLITITINEVKPSTDANGKPITNITGQTEPGNEVVVTLPDGTKLPLVTADKDGNWTVTTDIPLKDGDDIDATTTNQDGKPIDDAVSLPLISIDVVAGDDVINEQELIDLTVDGLFTITGTVSNPNADITVTFNGKEYNIPAKDITPDGKWSLKVPANEVGASNSITAIAKTDVVESVPAIRNPVLDNEPPTVQVSINDKGEITIKYAPDVDPSTIDPKEIVIKDEDGKRIKVELTPSEDGLTWTGKFPTGINGNVSVTVPDNSYADKSGNLGGQGTANKDIDITAPQVIVTVDEDGKVTLTYPDDVDPDSIITDNITVKDENGKDIPVTFDKQPDGSYTAQVPPGTDGTVKVEVPVGSYDDLTGNPGLIGKGEGPVDTTPPQVIVTVDEDGKITLTYPDDVDPKTIVTDNITVKDENGKDIPVTFDKQPDGSYTAQVPPGTDGTVKVEVPVGSYDDLTGNPGLIGKGEGPVDTTPPQVIVTVDEDGKITLTYPDDVDPDSIITDNITVKDENGKDIPVTFDKQPDGSYTAQVPPGTDGTVKVEVPVGSYDDLTGNPGLIGKGEGPVDTTPPQVIVTVDEDGKITLTYPDDVDPKTIVTDNITVKDENGKDIPVTFDKQPDGSYTAQVPPGTDGTVKVEVPVGSYDDLTGNPGLIGKGEGPVDTTPPQVIVTVDEDGKITLTYPDDVDPDSIITDNITVKDENGKDIPVTFDKQPDGSYTAQVPPGTDGTVKVEVPVGSYDDLTGNPGLIGKGEGPVDTTPPQVIVTVDEDGKITLTYPDDVDPDSIITDNITVKDENGKDIPVTFDKQPDGSYTAQVPPGTDGTVKVEVPVGSYDDLTGNPGLIGKGEGPVDTTPPQVIVTVDEDGKITLTYPDDVDPKTIVTDNITVKDENGKDIPVTFDKQPDGSYTAQVPPGTDGTVKVDVPTGSYDDLTGNSGLIGKGEGPVDTTPPQVIVTVDEDGKITLTYPDDVDPDSIITDNITVKDENGKDIPVTFDKQPDGSYTAQVPPGTDGTVKVEVPVGSYDDLTGNPGLIGKGEGPVDTTPPQVIVTVDEDGKITLTYPDDVDPKTIVTDNITVKDENGKDIPVTFDKQPDGSYTAQVPPGTDGTVKVDVPTGSYDDLTGNPGLIGKGEGPVDTTPPQVIVTVDEDGKVTLTYPDDVDPKTIVTDNITVKDENGKDIPVTFDKQPDGSYTTQVPPGTDGTVKVEVPAGSYDDLTGNPGLIGKGEGPVDTTPPQVIVTVDEDGKITLTYPDDVDPKTIVTDNITVKDENGKDIPVTFDKQPDGNYTGQVPPGTDGTVKVDVPAGSYDDLTGNPGLVGGDTGTVDTVAPIINPTPVITNEDQSVVLKWVHFGITDANTANANLMVTITHLPTDGKLYYTNASGNKEAIINGQKLTHADLESGKVTFEPDVNEASSNAGGTYADVGFSVSDGKHTTDGSIEIVVDAVADKPHLGFDLINWEPETVNLNIKTWSGLKEVTIDGNKHTLTGGGDGVSAETLKAVFEYLTSNQTTNPAASKGKTDSLSNGNVPTYNGVAIEGYIYLEAGHTYRYQGKADDSGLLIIGNNDPAYVSWGGSSTSVNKDFTVTESGFYTFDFYMHNQSGAGNYDFQLQDLAGDKISYFPDLQTAIDKMNSVYQGENSSVEWTVSDLLQKDAADKDQYGFHRPYFNLSGEVGKDISLGLLATGLNDKDGSEKLSLKFEGLIEGMQIYAVAQDGTRTLLGTADVNGILKFTTSDLSINGQSLVAVAPKNYIVDGASDTLDVKITATATEQSNGSEASTETEFDIILYPPTGVAATALLALPMHDDNIIFNLLNDTHTGGNTLRTEDNFSVGSYAKIDLSALLSDAATLNNLSEYVSVNYDANTDQAVISIDRDGTASAYQSQDLLILTHQTTDVTLDELLKNNQIII